MKVESVGYRRLLLE